MNGTVRGLRARLLGGDGPADGSLEPIEAGLEADETVYHRLQGTTDLALTRDGETSRLAGLAGGDPVALVTDRQVILAVETEDGPIAVPYTDVGKVDAEEGFLRSQLVLKSWQHGTFELAVADAEALGDAISYISAAVECWQYATSKLEAASAELPAVTDHFEAGRLGEGRTAREAVRENLARAAETLEDSPIEPSPALEAETAALRRKLHKAEVRARLTRANTLVTEAKHGTDARAYAVAADRLWEARDQLENARMLAREADIEEPAVIEAGLETVETRLEGLRVQPLALAKQARERADATDQLPVRIDALEEALAHYQDVLSAGWGTDIEFAGTEEHVRFQIEIVVGELVVARRSSADQCVEDADCARDDGDLAAARAALADAESHLEEAIQLASEFRTGDREALVDHLSEIRTDSPTGIDVDDLDQDRSAGGVYD